jgi:hypothetical protein
MYIGLWLLSAGHVSTLLHPPIVHLGPLLTSIKGRSRALVQEGGRAGGRADGHALSLSPSRTLVTPYYKRIRHGRRITRAAVPPFPPLVFHLAPTHLGWDTQRQLTRRSRDPPGSKRRQLACQVGACCVLTNSFPSSSRWVVSSDLSNPGRCSVLGVSSSCPSTAATTWYSFLRRATTTTTAVSPPDGGGIDDVFPVWQKSGIRVYPVTFPTAGEGGGTTMAKQEAALRWLSSESTTPAPQRGTRRALTSRLRRR